MLSSRKYATSMQILVLITTICITTFPTQCKEFSIDDLKDIEVISVPVETYRNAAMHKTQEGDKDSLKREGNFQTAFFLRLVILQ